MGLNGKGALCWQRNQFQRFERKLFHVKSQKDFSATTRRSYPQRLLRFHDVSFSLSAWHGIIRATEWQPIAVIIVARSRMSLVTNTFFVFTLQS